MHVSFVQLTSLSKGSFHKKLLPLDVQTLEDAGGRADERKLLVYWCEFTVSLNKDLRRVIHATATFIAISCCKDC